MDRDLSMSINSATLRRLYAYWLDRRGARAMPARSDIDPADFPYALGDVFLLDVERDPLRFRYRIYASHAAARRGYDLTGKYVHEIPDAGLRGFLLPIYARIAAEALPFHARRDMVLDNRTHTYEIIALPLAADQQQVDMLLVAVQYAPLEGAATV